MAPRTTTATKRRRLNSSTVNCPLPTLPFDLIVEILYRLPVKSLIQLKSVCKSWKYLISHPKFGKKHLHISTTRHNLLFRRLYKSEYIINACTLSSLVTKQKGVPTATATRQLQYPLSNRITEEYDQICGSCHGILCIKLNFVQSSVILWNPSIRKFTRLPSLKIQWTKGALTRLTSFGYDHSSDSYKVVDLSYTTFNNSFSQVKTHLHTVGTNSWRRIQDFPCVSLNSESGKFVSGTLNWLVFKDKDSFSSLVIVSLDLEKESYRELLLPHYGEVEVLSKSLWVLRDCLCILSSHIGAYSEVWLMKEYGNKDSWAKLFHVPHMELDHHCYTRALYVYEDDQVLLEFRSKLIVYNSRDGSFKTIKIQKWRGSMIPEVFQESLISPGS